MTETKLDEPSSEVNAVLTNAASLIDETAALLDGFSDETKDGRQQLYRAESAVANARALIALADRSVTPRALADQVGNDARALRDNVQAAASDGSGDVGSAVEALLASLVQLRQPAALLEEKAKEAARRYSQSLAPQMRAIKGEVERLETRLAEVEESTQAEVAAVSERLDGIKGEMEAAAARVAELISDQDAKFTEAQEKRREEHASAIADAARQLAEARTAFDERRNEAVARLDEVEEEIAETAAALGSKAVGIDHGAEYARQKQLAFRWSLVTIALLLAAAIVPTALGILKADQSPESVAGKITVALIIAGVAGYAAGLAITIGNALQRPGGWRSRSTPSARLSQPWTRWTAPTCGARWYGDSLARMALASHPTATRNPAQGFSNSFAIAAKSALGKAPRGRRFSPFRAFREMAEAAPRRCAASGGVASIAHPLVPQIVRDLLKVGIAIGLYAIRKTSSR